jgi:hypothetical protein
VVISYSDKYFEFNKVIYKTAWILASLSVGPKSKESFLLAAHLFAVGREKYRPHNFPIIKNCPIVDAVQASELNKHHHCYQLGQTNNSPLCYYFKYFVRQEETSDKCHRNATEIDSRRFSCDLYHCSHLCAALSVRRLFLRVK